MSYRKFEKAVFLDRDGVINKELGHYTHGLHEFELLPGVVESMKQVYEMGYGLIVITNQGGIAKGLYTEEDVLAIHQWLQGVCVQHGFAIDAFYHCPHHPEAGTRCLCRKPGSLMLEKAMHHFGLKPENCVFFGDHQRDMDAAAKAGIKGVLIPSNEGFRAALIA